jgi:hypothetical protein
MIVQLKALELVAALHDRRLAGATLDAEETAFLELARTKRAELEAIRAASNLLAPSPPADYQSDARWPSPS